MFNFDIFVTSHYNLSVCIRDPELRKTKQMTQNSKSTHFVFNRYIRTPQPASQVQNGPEGEVILPETVEEVPRLEIGEDKEASETGTGSLKVPSEREIPSRPQSGKATAQSRATPNPRATPQPNAFRAKTAAPSRAKIDPKSRPSSRNIAQSAVSKGPSSQRKIVSAKSRSGTAGSRKEESKASQSRPKTGRTLMDRIKDPTDDEDEADGSDAGADFSGSDNLKSK